MIGPALTLSIARTTAGNCNLLLRDKTTLGYLLVALETVLIGDGNSQYGRLDRLKGVLGVNIFILLFLLEVFFDL